MREKNALNKLTEPNLHEISSRVSQQIKKLTRLVEIKIESIKCVLRSTWLTMMDVCVWLVLLTGEERRYFAFNDCNLADKRGAKNASSQYLFFAKRFLKLLASRPE